MEQDWQGPTGRRHAREHWGEQRQLARVREGSACTDRQLCRCFWTARCRDPRRGRPLGSWGSDNRGRRCLGGDWRRLGVGGALPSDTEARLSSFTEHPRSRTKPTTKAQACAKPHSRSVSPRPTSTASSTPRRWSAIPDATSDSNLDLLLCRDETSGRLGAGRARGDREGADRRQFGDLLCRLSLPSSRGACRRRLV